MTGYARGFSTRRNNGSNTAALVVMILVAVVAIGFPVAASVHTETYTGCEVTGKERTLSTDRERVEARVYTSCGVFTVGDDWLRGKWSSADVYGALREGGRYDLTATGWRLPFFSRFPNIIDAQEIQP